MKAFTHQIKFKGRDIEPIYVYAAEAEIAKRVQGTENNFEVNGNRYDGGQIRAIIALREPIMSNRHYLCSHPRCNGASHAESDTCPYEMNSNCSRCNKPLQHKDATYSKEKFDYVCCYDCSPHGILPKPPHDAPYMEKVRHGFIVSAISRGQSLENATVAANKLGNDLIEMKSKIAVETVNI